MRDAGDMQRIAVRGAVGALRVLNSPLSSPEIRLWIALCSLTIAGAACFLHAPCAAGSYAAIVLLGTIISHARLGWPGAVMGLAAAAIGVAVARDIGRASGRDRGCQSVSISVVAVYLTKNQH